MTLESQATILLSATTVDAFRHRFESRHLFQVCDGAVVTGFVVGHRYTLLNEEIVLELTPTTVGGSKGGELKQHWMRGMVGVVWNTDMGGLGGMVSSRGTPCTPHRG